ncbi:hypothetical protein GQ600_9351 [Phytophthora cactorum]|nr:hypothetical protein GQ600_9351 [Phytophthora cactorum]
MEQKYTDFPKNLCLRILRLVGRRLFRCSARSFLKPLIILTIV